MLVNKTKKKLINTFNQFLSHPSVVDVFNRQVKKSLHLLPKLDNQTSPYHSMDNQLEVNKTFERDDIVFISSRFRSGSTVLWNVFRNLNDATAYYEPFNERRWFDESCRGENVDSTHLGVDNYWQEFVGLNELSKYYHEDWIRDELFMDGAAFNPDMKRFIEICVENSKARPVLQFNRIDFRLPWLKATFPNCKILHLYRNPRDQWLSFLTDKKIMNAQQVEQTYKDAFYLNPWCNNLKNYFPFLSEDITPHPYQRFYYLWKLSFLFGQKYSDISIGFEQLSHSPKSVLTEVLTVLNWHNPDIDKAAAVVEQVQLDKWKSYADDAWFLKHELACETVLSQFLDNQNVR
ncbi:sulfotransferase [Catenovulum sp. 2E275]|uniref:sulfotransferase n=1 Tax=Catenovulum sp. 2E275 TaxID=2980497 RepID=UPI0021CFF57D|nr:sulfotransferase [Catenovulum sp. 2E275]MCU4675554.1 sulfotransferase [Catenovulum sp. 2E275]